ncbi:MAG: precorrin-6A reductase [Lachnospiraceae bacterium]|nr:precorrin-6A reductase [Lachnospiraceae bacterium]
MNIVIFSGTTEGRILSDALSNSKIMHHVCVATKSGEEVMESSEYALIHVGRLDEDRMREFLDSVNADFVIDATHPYAKIVTETIRKVSEEKGLKYVRVLRSSSSEKKENSSIRCFGSTKDCALKLKDTVGNILLTTGSKELTVFSQDEDIRGRLYVRVLPNEDAISKCREAGIDEKHIIAMYGPHTEEMNVALMRQFNIEHLVTKESGSAGGFEEKLDAARKACADVYLIERPYEEVGISLKECLELLDVDFPKTKMHVTLGGVGMGNNESRTIALDNALKRADYVLGAKRMLETYEGPAITKAIYQSDEVIEFLKGIKNENEFKDKYIVSVVILFSGDTGIFSGASKMYEKLRASGECDSITILPGISSFSAFSASLGVDYKYARLESLHGISDNTDNLKRITSLISKKEIVYLLMSGVSDFSVLKSCIPDSFKDTVIFDVGYELSYENERIFRMNYSMLKNIESMELEEGLYIVRVSYEKL